LDDLSDLRGFLNRKDDLRFLDYRQVVSEVNIPIIILDMGVLRE